MSVCTCLSLFSYMYCYINPPIHCKDMFISLYIYLVCVGTLLYLCINMFICNCVDYI